ncbi:hypothetical protein KUTeg_019294 [Tegillarca granosa]|uniref:Leishmanolysin-like peptidase n=1 Tax=Tegillarca granosa TaxID=220873 RepID=A0ABQ9EC40_TEGGR|nr:hypothetical protein KUTeg_019294 [Tegillarca granosa]
MIILSRCIKAHGIYESGATISCGHQPPDREQVIHDVQLEAAHTIIKRSADQPLRIHLHFDDSIHSLPSRQRGLVKNMVREAVLYWEDTLFVKRTDVPIRLNRQCSTTVRYKDGYKRYCVDGCSPITRCGDIFIPPQHLEACYFWNSFTKMWMVGNNAGPGVVDADFILFVAALSTGRCQKARTIAYAAHCQQEAALDRPVAGYFSICPESISVEKQDHLQLLSTIKHEMLHALEEVRKHFNCSTLEGAELEDQGIIGTNLTHWEKRIFEYFRSLTAVPVSNIDRYGGSVALADFCPYLQYQCRERLGLLIYVNGKAHHCLKAGQKLRVNFVSKYYLHTGHIICPSCQEMCQKSGITCPPEHEPTFQIVSEITVTIILMMCVV